MNVVGRAVSRQMDAGGPVKFILPAFPAKSPNPEKVLGHLPDMGEELALRSMDQMCRQIQRLYAPGGRILTCSDGRVFNDAVGIADRHVTAYQNGMRELLDRLGISSIDLWGLDEVYPGLSHRDMRATLMFNHGESPRRVREAVKQGGNALRMYQGITRFLFEDADRADSTVSNSALQRDCRRRAYEVSACRSTLSRAVPRRSDSTSPKTPAAINGSRRGTPSRSVPPADTSS